LEEESSTAGLRALAACRRRMASRNKRWASETERRERSVVAWRRPGLCSEERTADRNLSSVLFCSVKQSLLKTLHSTFHLGNRCTCIQYCDQVFRFDSSFQQAGVSHSSRPTQHARNTRKNLDRDSSPNLTCRLLTCRRRKYR